MLPGPTPAAPEDANLCWRLLASSLLLEASGWEELDAAAAALALRLLALTTAVEAVLLLAGSSMLLE
jgi:hypothetical protein